MFPGPCNFIYNSSNTPECQQHLQKLSRFLPDDVNNYNWNIPSGIEYTPIATSTNGSRILQQLPDMHSYLDDDFCLHTTSPMDDNDDDS